MSEDTRTPGAVIRLQADSIYTGSILRVLVQARQPFTVRVAPDPVQVVRGRMESACGALSAQEKDGIYDLEYVTTEAFVESRVTPGTEEGPAYRYGMRFFPFFSSTCSTRLTFDSRILTAVVLELPDDYRMIWYKSTVEPGHGSAERQHSFGASRSSYVFRFSTPTDSCTCDILLRLGGQSITELVRYRLHTGYSRCLGSPFCTQKVLESFLEPSQHCGLSCFASGAKRNRRSKTRC